MICLASVFGGTSAYGGENLRKNTECRIFFILTPYFTNETKNIPDNLGAAV
jgi:hypothetical protein